MKTTNRRAVKIVLGVIAAIIVFVVAAGIFGYTRSLSRKKGVYVYTEEERVVSSHDSEELGEVTISTLPLDLEFGVRRATYTYSGSVLIGYMDGTSTVVCSVNDDGSDLKELYRGKISSGYRLLPFADNARILMGDSVLECPEGTTFETCEPNSATLVPIDLPAEFSSDAAVTDPWTEVIIAQDCEHFAWTIRRSDCGAVNAMGRLVRTTDSYEVEDAVYISNMDPLTEDPENPGCSVYSPVIGGEVKQFVRVLLPVHCLDRAPGKAVEYVETPAVGSYAAEPAESFDYDTTVMGKVSGSAHMSKTSGKASSAAVTVTYDNFSDDGKYFYNGTETPSGSITANTDYSSDLKVTDADGKECGNMQVTIRLGLAYSVPNLISGNTSPHLDTAKSSGTAVWDGAAVDMTKLVP